MSVMKTEQALDQYLARNGLSRSDRWLYILVGGLHIPYLPRAPFDHFLTVHDIHHMITGYSTGIRDEIYLIAWELASGGWGRHNWWYFGKSIPALLGLLHSPVGTWNALKTGYRQRNLYSFPKLYLFPFIHGVRLVMSFTFDIKPTNFHTYLSGIVPHCAAISPDVD